MKYTVVLLPPTRFPHESIRVLLKIMFFHFVKFHVKSACQNTFNSHPIKENIEISCFYKYNTLRFSLHFSFAFFVVVAFTLLFLVSFLFWCCFESIDITLALSGMCAVYTIYYVRSYTNQTRQNGHGPEYYTYRIDKNRKYACNTFISYITYNNVIDLLYIRVYTEPYIEVNPLFV